MSYVSYYSGAAIDEAVSRARKIHHGTDIVTNVDGRSAANVSLGISGYTPDVIIPTIRREGVADPTINVCISIYHYSDTYYAHLYCADDSATLNGTYYVDWIAIENSVAGSDDETDSGTGFEINDTLVMKDGVLGVNLDNISDTPESIVEEITESGIRHFYTTIGLSNVYKCMYSITIDYPDSNNYDPETDTTIVYTKAVRKNRALHFIIDSTEDLPVGTEITINYITFKGD